jgi:Protein of unknown function (DUF4087)
MTKLFFIIVGVLLLTSISFGEVSLSNRPRDVKLETRCGWFSNPTPGNAWLVDRDGEWLIGIQGGHQSEGDWPVFKKKEWVRVNNNYGYGCACIKMRVDHETSYVLEIKSATARPLSACRKDRSLKEPK